jgi:HlyD family secretion protein
MKQLIVIVIVIFLLLPSCIKKKPNIITYDLKHSDFLETVDATGTIQPVNNIMLVAPSVNALGLTVIYLAKEGTHVLKGDTICILESTDLATSFESLSRDLEKIEGDMKKLEANNAMHLALLNAQVETNKAQLAISMLDSVQLKFAPSVKKRLLTLEMERVNFEKTKLQKKLAAQKRIDNSELIRMRSRIMMQKSRILMYQNQINSLSLVAPCNGIVMHYESPVLSFMSSQGAGTFGGKIEEGTSVFSNMSLLQIPELEEMQVSVEIPEAEYRRIESGQMVSIRVEAAANMITTGRIKRKTLEKKSPQQTQAVNTYEVIISIDSCHHLMKPGLSANCRIIVKQVKDTIIVPASAIFGRDSLKIVYVADGEKFIPVTVETGFSNSSKSIISKGLTGNETIALMEPPYNLIRKEVKSKADSTFNSNLGKKGSVIKSSLIKN